ncbi:MAG TPA: UDP-N-acetylmuramoyl-tripeptide--D-alanyl-D-alanine ligase [Flavobacterium sp.]|jgi:UDP-N-acetylmuramoyl-tripeptide--D-alanyl-D-alanine ligase
MDIQYLHQLFLNCSSISTDTRKIEQGSMFIALKGENFDANTFANEALEKGASYVVIDNQDFAVDERMILVADSLVALQQLAQFHRDYLAIPIIGLTGSNGKTTTKELLHAVLSKKYRTSATKGNLNNHIGVPLTILSFTSDTEIGIVEMGANHRLEIAALSEISRPDYGYITNFGKAHLEGFGGPEGVIKGKSELYDYLGRNSRTVFVNLDDKLQAERTTNHKRYTFSNSGLAADVHIDSINANPFVHVRFDGETINSKLIGLYNGGNVSAAIAVGQYFGVSTLEIKQAIEAYVPENNRSQLVHKNGNEIILDAYNANPSSMAVAIENFLQIDNDNKMMILGDMFELGSASHDEHFAVLTLLEHEYSAVCHFVGKEFHEVRIPKDNFHFYLTFEELAEQLQHSHSENKLILIKGSRGMALERALDYL